MVNTNEAQVSSLKQLIKEKLIETDGNIILSEHPVIESRSKDLGLTERDISRLIQEVFDSVNWDKERQRDTDSATSPIIINDEKVYSVKKLGKILFENPDFAASYLRNDSILTGNINYLTSQNGSKAATLGDIYNSEQEYSKRYLKVIYHLNQELPYRLMDNEMAESPFDLAELIFKDQKNYLTGKKQFDTGAISIWLQAKDKELARQVEEVRLNRNDDSFAFLEAMYSLNSNLPFKFNGKDDIATPEALALKIDADSGNWGIGKRAFLSGYIALWLNKTGKSQVQNNWETKRNSLSIDKEKDISPDDIFLEEFLQILNPSLPKPKLTINQEKVEFLNITTKKTIEQEIVVQNSTRGYLEIKNSFSTVLPGVDGSPQVAVLSKYHTSDTQKLKIHIDASSYRKGVLNQTLIELKKSDGSTDKIPVRFKVVFPVLAYTFQLLIYGLIGAAFFAGIRQLLANFTGNTYWLSLDDRLTSYIPLNARIYALDKFFYPFMSIFLLWCFASVLIVLICTQKMKYFKWLILLTVATLIYTAINPKVFAIISVNAFLFMDKLLQVSEVFIPVLVWAFFGFFLGTTLGGFIARKKIQLTHKFWIIPLGSFALICFVFLLITKPLAGSSQTGNFFVKKIKAYAYNFIYSPRASSELPPYSRISFGAGNLIDGRSSTAWVENASSSGINETIDYTFPSSLMKNYQEVNCTGFLLVNGYSKSSTTYADYNRINTFTVSVNGIASRNCYAQDKMGERQEITFEPFKINGEDRITVTINSVYFGKRKNDKTAISELVPILEYY